MRIGVLTTSYPRHPDDWAGRFVADLAGWLAQLGDHVDVLAPYPARSIHPFVTVRSLRYAIVPQLLYGAGAPDNLFGRNPIGQRARAWAQAPAFIGQLTRACWQRSRRWERLISHWLIPCGLIASRSGHGRPHLAIAHSSDVHLLRRLPGGGRLLARLLRPRCGLVLTSESLRQPLLELPGLASNQRDLVGRAPVVTMGVDPPPQLHKRSWPRDGERMPIVLFVGRLIALKGVDVLIDACRGLVLELIVIGDGPERAALEMHARHSGVRVRFLGEQGRDQTWAWLQTADVLALPSRILPDGRTDSAPLVVLEALCAGLPVVATRVGGIGSLIEHEVQGLLVEPSHISALHDAISTLVSNEERRRLMAEAARRRSLEFYWDKIGATLRQLLLTL